jgi:autotransporter-associated beta strand protein
MKSRASRCLALAAASSLAWFSKTAFAATPEVRATWITTTGYTTSTSDIYNAQTTNSTFSSLRSIGLNTVYMDMWRNGNTYFQSPTNAAITGSLMDPATGSRDIDADAILQAHRNQMSVFGWYQYGLMAAYGNPSTSTSSVSGYMKSKGWLLQDSSGAYTDASNGYSWMNPLVPQVQTYITNMLLDAVNKYNFQGIQLDDHMGWPIQFGYDAYTKAAYLAATGNAVPTSYSDAAFTAWRSQQLTTFLQSLVATLHKDKPSLIISDSPPIYPFSYSNYCENWPQWQQLGLFNEYVPQVYTSSSSTFKTDWNGTGGVLSNFGGSYGSLVGGIAINSSAGYNSYSSDVLPSATTVRSTSGVGGEAYWYSDGVLQNQASLTSLYNVAGLGQANRPDVPASELMAPIEGVSGSSSSWQFTVTTGQYYDLIAANGSTWRTQQTAIYLAPGTYSFPVSSASQVELLENSTVALNSPLAAQWNVSSGGTWSTDTNWSQLIVPDGSGATANLFSGPGITSPASISLDSNRILGHLNFNSAQSYTIAAGGGTLTIDSTGPVATGVPSISVSAGNQIIAAPLTLAPAGVTITATSGAGLLISGAINGPGGLIESGSGKLTLSGANTYAGGTNVSAGTLFLTASGALPANTSLTIGTNASVIASGLGSSTALVIGSLNVGGSIDVQNTGLDITSSKIKIVTGYLAAGYNSGKWNGTSGSILSSTAAADATHLSALGVIVNDNGSGSPLYGSGGTIAGTFDGVVPAGGDVLVKLTDYGDLNLDGVVDGTDYSRIDLAYLTNLTATVPLTGWYNGDLNYDGAIDGSDYTLMDNAFNSQGAQLTSEFAVVTAQIADTGSTSAVPEPTALLILPIAVSTALARRPRRGIVR